MLAVEKFLRRRVLRPLVVTRLYCVVMRGNRAVAYPAVINRLPMGFTATKTLSSRNFPKR